MSDTVEQRLSSIEERLTALENLVKDSWGMPRSMSFSDLQEPPPTEAPMRMIV